MNNTKKGLDLQQLEQVSGGTANDASIPVRPEMQCRDDENLHHLTGRGDENLHHLTGRGDENLHHLTGRDDDNLHHRVL